MSKSSKDLYEFGEFVLDCSERTLWRNNEVVPLSPKSAETLCLLVENHNRLMTKDELMDHLWADTFVEERNLAQNIFVLRKILGNGLGGGKFIETVPRRGYRFVGDVRPLAQREEFVEVSLSDSTTIRADAEGGVPSKYLAEAVNETARSLALGVPEKRAQSLAKYRRPRTALAAGAILLFAVGAIFVWQSYRADSNRSSAASLPRFSDIRLERLTDTGKAFFPHLSRDKKQMVYVYNDKGQDSLRIQNLATSSVTEVRPPSEAIISSPFFSGDGNHIYYRVYEGGKEGTIYQVPIFGGSQRRIVGDVRSDASISPDGEWLAFIRYEIQGDSLQLVVCGVNGANERVVASASSDTIFLDWGQAPAWSPDNQKILVAATDTASKRIELLEYDLATGGASTLTSPAWNGVGRFLWLPDRSGLVVIAQEGRDANYQLWHLSYPSGEARRITNDLSNYVHLAMSADGEFLLTNEQQTTYNLWTVAAADEAARQITSKTAVSVGGGGVNWSPDGKRIVYTVAENKPSNLWICDSDGSTPTQLTFDAEKRNWLPSFTPDGNSIVFASNRSGRSHIWAINTDGSDLRQLTDGDGEGFPQVTPDGKWLLYVSPADVPKYLYKRPLGGGEPVLIFDNARGSNSVAPGSDRVLFSYYDDNETIGSPWKYGIKSLDGNDEVKQVGVNPYLGGMTWKRDGTGFYYVKDGRTVNNLWFFDLVNETSKQVTHFDDLKMRFVSLSPDEERFAISRGSTTSEVIKISPKIQ